MTLYIQTMVAFALEACLHTIWLFAGKTREQGLMILLPSAFLFCLKVHLLGPRVAPRVRDSGVYPVLLESTKWDCWVSIILDVAAGLSQTFRSKNMSQAVQGDFRHICPKNHIEMIGHEHPKTYSKLEVP